MINTSVNITGANNASYLKYLSFIQDIITRMNRNAFQLKGWCITVLAALSALGVNSEDGSIFFVAALAVLPFGVLDGYYLQMERQFRGLYNDVINGCPDIRLFSMPINRYTKKVSSKYDYKHVLFSGSVCGFYLPLFVISIIVGIAYIVSADSHETSSQSLVQHQYSSSENHYSGPCSSSATNVHEGNSAKSTVKLTNKDNNSKYE